MTWPSAVATTTLPLATAGEDVTGEAASSKREGSSDASACCGEKPGPNTPSPGGTTIGPGGGRTGALLISPYVQPGSVNDTPYNHYSLLRSIEDVFGLGHLGFAGAADLGSFGADVYNGP